MAELRRVIFQRLNPTSNSSFVELYVKGVLELIFTTKTTKITKTLLPSHCEHSKAIREKFSILNQANSLMEEGFVIICAFVPSCKNNNFFLKFHEGKNF
jgi:hypothetical protein